MHILLFGEYSNVHHTLCEALRRAGHEVLLVSDGDGWKDYPRDVDLRRTKEGPLGSLLYLSRLATLLPKLRDFDVVQIVNPIFLDVKPRWNRWVFDYLKRHNGIMSVGCFGDDYYVVSRMQDDRYLSYTDFYADGRTIGHEVNRRRISTWTEGPKAELTRYVMRQADCLVACLYEYWKVYDTPEFQPRLHYIPLPVEERSNPSNLSNPSNSSTPSTLPALAAAAQKVIVARRELGVARGAMSPSLSISGGISTSYNKMLHSPATGFRDQLEANRGEYIYASVSIPIFNRLQTLTNIRRQRNNLRIAEEELAQTRDELAKLQLQAENECEGYRRQTLQMQHKVEADSIAARLTTRKYEEGLSSAIDVQTSAATLLESRARLLQCRLMLALKRRLADYYRGLPLIVNY